MGRHLEIGEDHGVGLASVSRRFDGVRCTIEEVITVADGNEG